MDLVFSCTSQHRKVVLLVFFIYIDCLLIEGQSESWSALVIWSGSACWYIKITASWCVVILMTSEVKWQNDTVRGDFPFIFFPLGVWSVITLIFHRPWYRREIHHVSTMSFSFVPSALRHIAQTRPDLLPSWITFSKNPLSFLKF